MDDLEGRALASLFSALASSPRVVAVRSPLSWRIGLGDSTEVWAFSVFRVIDIRCGDRFADFSASRSLPS